MPRVERASSPDLLLQEGFMALAHAYEQEAAASRIADPEAWRFAHAKIGDVLKRITHELEQVATHQTHESFHHALSGPETFVLREIGRDIQAFVEACAPTAVGEASALSFDDDLTPRSRRYPLPTLAEKARKTDDTIVRLGGRLVKALNVLLETSDRFALEPQERELLSRLAMSLEVQLVQRAHWLALELQSRQFLDILARFRRLCVANDTIRKKRHDPSFYEPAMQAFRQQLDIITTDLARHPLGSSLLDLCTVEAFETDIDRQRVRKRLLNLEEHALEGYGITRPRNEYLDRRQVEQIRRQEKEVVSVHARVAFLAAYFR